MRSTANIGELCGNGLSRSLPRKRSSYARWKSSCCDAVRSAGPEPRPCERHADVLKVHMRDAQLVRPFRKRRQLTDDFVLQLPAARVDQVSEAWLVKSLFFLIV